MTDVFADTFYYLALANPADRAHSRAIEASKDRKIRHVTHAWVLAEVADALSAPGCRGYFTELLALLRNDPRATVVPPTEELFMAGAAFYAARPDKDWSLTDCISFVVMERHGLRDALTGDQHFAQAGFRALLR